MAQTGYTPLQLYYSATTTNVPLVANLSAGELAINTADGKLFYKDSSNALQVIGWKTTPTTAGGTGLTSYTAGDLTYYASGTTFTKLPIGAAGKVLSSSGTAPQWVDLSTVGVNTISFGSTGLTPATATGGAISVAGTLVVANGGTGSTNASGARANLSAAQSGANTDITSVTLTTGTISTAPSNNTDIVNKLYADSVGTGINFHPSCSYATTTALSAAYTYNNGSSGIGATITSNANGTLTIDGYTFVIGDVGKRILIKNEVGSYVNNTTPSAAFNGAYTLTQAGTASLPYILTRATDYDSSGTGTNEIDQGDFFLIISGTTNANTSWIQQTALPITVGTTSLSFVQFAAGPTYPISVANGGTGSSTVAGAQTNLQVDPAGTAVAMAIALG